MQISGSNTAPFSPSANGHRANSAAPEVQTAKVEQNLRPATDEKDNRSLRSQQSSNQEPKAQTAALNPQQVEPSQARDLPSQDSNIRNGMSLSPVERKTEGPENKAISNYLTMKNEGSHDVQNKDPSLFGVDVYV